MLHISLAACFCMCMFVPVCVLVCISSCESNKYIVIQVYDIVSLSIREFISLIDNEREA